MCLSWKSNLLLVISPLKLANLFGPADLSLHITSSKRSSACFQEVSPPAKFPELLLLVDSTYPSTFPELQLHESKANGSLGNPCVPGM